MCWCLAVWKPGGHIPAETGARRHCIRATVTTAGRRSWPMCPTEGGVISHAPPPQGRRRHVTRRRLKRTSCRPATPDWMNQISHESDVQGLKLWHSFFQACYSSVKDIKIWKVGFFSDIILVRFTENVEVHQFHFNMLITFITYLRLLFHKTFLHSIRWSAHNLGCKIFD